MYLVHSDTHLELAQAVKELAEIVNDLCDRKPPRLTEVQSMKVSKALTLREVAIYQLKIAGVTIEK